MHYQTIIVGQGLSGSWLSYWLWKANHSFAVIDTIDPLSASRVASGVINPVTGRVLAKTWMAETLLPFCLEAYTAWGRELGFDCIKESSILHFFPTTQMMEAFYKRMPEIPEFLQEAKHPDRWHPYFAFNHGLGAIDPALLVDINSLLQHWRKKLQADEILIEEKFDPLALQLSDDAVAYMDIKADRIIFCDGIASSHYPWFEKLPFAPNKGEALIVEIDGLPGKNVYKKGFSLVPFPHYQESTNETFFWAGSTYENNYKDQSPTDLFRERTLLQLKEWIRLPFRLVDHWAGIRPATLDRRPFVGFHPNFKRLGMLNGMGTKGCSLAAWFGKQMADHIVNGTAIQADAGLQRFRRVLNL